MKLPDHLRERFVRELQFAVNGMRSTADPFGQLYYFSVGYGEASRLLNFQWDPELALLHLVLQTTHQAINTYLHASATSQERVIRLPGEFMDRLADATEELIEVVRDKRDAELYRVLWRFAVLTYMTTGNGYYLYLKGALALL